MLSAVVTALSLVAPARPVDAPRRSRPLVMKGVAGFAFNLNMWYGDDNFAGKRPDMLDTWVSPWAEAHHKIRQQEIEIEQCRWLRLQAIQAEDYGEAQGLQTRIERLESAHPLLWREQRVEEALADGNFGLATVFQRDLDAVKTNLGLPKFIAGQMVRHLHRPSLRGIVIDVDLLCVKPDAWAVEASCIERAVAAGVPAEECLVAGVTGWRKQPFYAVLPDLGGSPWEGGEEMGVGKADQLPWPNELSAWQVNYRMTKFPPPVYLAEGSLGLDTDDRGLSHPELTRLFEQGHDFSEHLGRLYQPTPRLRLWQQQQAKGKQEAQRQKRYQRIGLNDGTFFLS